MDELLNRLLQGLDSYYVWSAFKSVPHLIFSTTLVFWLIVYIFVRFQLPNFLLYAAYLINHRWFEPPPLRRYAGNEPLISFLIAGRNTSESITACIDSILASNYKNIEIIYADDNSTDNSMEVVRKFERTGQVRAVRNAVHGGKAAGMNLALMFARGEFIFILDSDSLAGLKNTAR